MRSMPRRLRNPRSSRLCGRWLLCGALAGGVSWLVPLHTAEAQDTSTTNASSPREARLAYEAGLLLHREGEFEAAANQFIQAIGQDPSLDRAYAALTDAQVMASRDRVLRALRAADEGDLASAQRHAQQAVALDGENPQAIAVAQSFSAPRELLSDGQLTAFHRAVQLNTDKQWRLAREQLAALVGQAPLFLPARAGLHRAAHFEGRANDLANEGIALMQQHRLGPAVEHLAAASAIWPYHPDAGESLEQAQALAHDAQQAAERAAAAIHEDDPEHALRRAQAALAIDRSNMTARDAARDAERLLAERAVAAGDAMLDDGNYAGAKAEYTEALGHVSGYPDARRGMGRAYQAQGEQLAIDGRDGAALLAYLAGREHDRAQLDRAAQRTGRQVLRGTDVAFALDVPEHAPALGVDSESLFGELATQPTDNYLDHNRAEDARYVVQVRINDTDVELRRIRSINSSFFHSNGFSSGFTRWEKRGSVACTVTVTDRESGETIRRWDADRWVSYSDSQQYVVGTTWRRSNRTLPSDQAVANRLAGDLAEAVWPDIREAVTLARARALRDEAEQLAEEGDAAGALERRVAATLLAGQINPREGERAMRDLALDFDRAE